MSREKIFFLTAIAGLCVYAVIAVLLPLKGRVADNQETIRLLARELARSPATAEGPDQAGRELEGLQTRLEKLAARIPPETKNAETIILLSTLAENRGLHQTHLSESGDSQVPGRTEAENRLLSNTFLWKGSGCYPDVKGFIKDLEGSERLLEISDISLVKTAESEPEASVIMEDSQISVSFRIRTYYHPADGPAKELPPPAESEKEKPGDINPFR